MSVFFETLKLMSIGMSGIFIAILIFYFLIKAMIKVFPN